MEARGSLELMLLATGPEVGLVPEVGEAAFSRTTLGALFGASVIAFCPSRDMLRLPDIGGGMAVLLSPLG